MAYRYGNTPVFAVNTPQSLLRQVGGIAAGPENRQTQSEENGGLCGGHPATVQAIKIIQSHPASSGFENSTYYGLNAFWFRDANGKSTPVRWSWRHAAVCTREYGRPGRARQKLPVRWGDRGYPQHPLQWHLVITVGQADDPTNDATIPWPDAREQVEVGL